MFKCVFYLIWLLILSRSFEDGHKEGFDKGKLKGLHEGWSLGVQKGTEISSEVLGFISLANLQSPLLIL